MKNRKFSGVFALVMSLCLALTTFSFLGAKAAGDDASVTTIEKTVVAAVKYSVTDLYAAAGDDDTVKSVKKVVDGVETDAVKADDKDKSGDYWLSSDEKDITFNYVATTLKVVLNLKGETEAEDAEQTVNVTVVKNSDVDPSLALDADTVEKVQNAVSTAKIDDKKFEVPDEIWDLLDKSSVVYPLSKITAKIYVKNPSSGWSSSYATSGKKSSTLRISVSDAGTYSFYVLFSVSDYNPTTGKSEEIAIEKDSEWEEFNFLADGADGKLNGFYEKDEDGKPVGSVKIPVFTFEYNPDKKVAITEKISVRTAQAGSAYSSLSFTLENSIKAKCVLKYKDFNDSEWKVATEDDADFDESVFSDYTSGTTLKFTPLKTGQFKVECRARGVNDDEALLKESSVISVNRKTVVRPAVNTALRDFFTNNWKSVIFLGIAVLCLIAIIIIACWKPKDETAKVSVEDAKANTEKEVEEAPVEAADTVVEETEEVSENVLAEEVTEEQAENVDEEVSAEAEADTEETVSEAEVAPVVEEVEATLVVETETVENAAEAPVEAVSEEAKPE